MNGIMILISIHNMSVMSTVRVDDLDDACDVVKKLVDEIFNRSMFEYEINDLLTDNEVFIKLDDDNHYTFSVKRV